ncbi:unnamed protein product [Heterobilharzia americana]|nr:unnamed protein product [Heterobilharzia americana]
MPAAPIGVSSTRRTYSTIDFEEIFDTSLDVTVNNTTSSHNNSIGSSNNISTHTNSNNMNRSISAIGSRRHHSTSSALGNTNANNTITLINNNTNNNSTSSGGINNNNFKSNSAWSTESVNRPRITHWHNNNNNNETKSRKAVNTKGNIFLQRSDFSVFTKLPNYKQNAYFIQMDDDSSQLTNHRVSEVYCLACQQILPIYDHFPVIDGIFFISPLCHRSTEGYRKGGGLRVTWHTNGIQNQSVQQQQQQQQHQPQQQQQTNRTCTTNNNSNSSSSSNIGNNGSTNLVSSTNDYQCINKIALKLLAPLKIMSPPPGCLGPRQQLNSAQHNNMMSTLTSDQNSLFSASTSSSRYSVVGTSTRQGRYLHALCMNCMHTEHLVVNTHDSKRNGSDNNSNNNDNNNNNNNNNNNKSSEFKCIRCKVCSKLWSGASLLVGGLYTYDIFAAVPCCPAHLTCGSCQSRLDDFSNQSSSSIPPSSTSTTSGQIVSTSQAAIQQLSSNDLPHQYYHDQKNHTLHSMTNRIDEIHDKSSSDLTIKSYPLSYFSQYSNMIICPYCSKVDYHFVKLFEDTYEVVSCC